MRDALEAGLALLASRGNLFVVRGLQDSRDRLTWRAWLVGTRWGHATDMVRNGALELACRDIERLDIPGAAAEVGVFRGEFAALINRFLPDRTLYLFDTFEGYDARDAGDTHDPDHAMPAGFDNTSIDMVRARLPNPDRASFRQGWFPATAHGLEDERFVFVSVDVTLEAPTAAAIRWFWPRLQPGGVMFIQDFQSTRHSGVRDAVDACAKELGFGWISLPDRGGTAAIVKPPAS